MTFRYPFEKICPSLALRTCIKMLFTFEIYISVSHNPIVLSRNIYFLTKMTFASITVVLDVISSELTTCDNLLNIKNGLRRLNKIIITSNLSLWLFCFFMVVANKIISQSTRLHTLEGTRWGQGIKRVSVRLR